MKRLNIKTVTNLIFSSFILFGCSPKDKGSELQSSSGMAARAIAISQVIKSDNAKKILREGAEDFDLIVSGKMPKNSKQGYSTLDGVTNYDGQGYTLQLIDSTGSVSGSYVNIYGAILVFKDSEFTFMKKEISDVRIYSHEAYLSLKGVK